MAEKVVDPFDIDEVPSSGALLDPTKPYGLVTGEGDKRFYQDGRYFDYRGALLSEVG